MCDFCKPPKREKTPINALCREDRTHMLALAVRAQPAPLAATIELALTTGMSRGEVCALRCDDGTITVSHALGSGPGGFYMKEPETRSSALSFSLTTRTYDMLRALRMDAMATCADFGMGFGDPYIFRHARARQPPVQPHHTGQGFCGVLHDERL